jgi:hypothetical protein
MGWFRRDYLDHRISNWRDVYSIIGSDKGHFIAFSLASAAYGGLHALAWKELFPTPAEELLWKISSLFIASSGFCCCLYLSLSQLYIRSNMLGVFRKLVWFLKDQKAFRYPMYVMVYLILVFYVAARGYLVVEAFISLRKLPIEVYTTPTWTQFLPHL